MSSHASDAIRIELPGRPWAERVSDGLVAVAATAVAWVSSRWVPVAFSIAAMAAGLVVGYLLHRRRAPAGSLDVLASASTRRLGPTLVVRVRRAGGQAPARAVWLTPLDLPPGLLRRLVLRVSADARGSRS